MRVDPPPEPARVWHWMPAHESAHEYDLFSRWLYLGGDFRAFSSVARAMRLSIESLQLTSLAKCWEERAGHYRAWLATVADKACEAEAITVARAKLTALRLVDSAMNEAQASLDAEREARGLRRGASAVPVTDALRVAMKAPSAVAAVAACLPEEHVPADDLDYSRLSIEDLSSLRALHAKAARRAG